MYLCVRSHIFSLPLNERFTFALKTTLHKDGTPDTGEYEQVSANVQRVSLVLSPRFSFS